MQRRLQAKNILALFTCEIMIIGAIVLALFLYNDPRDMWWNFTNEEAAVMMIIIVGAVQVILVAAGISFIRRKLRFAKILRTGGVRGLGARCPDCGTLLVGSPAYCPRCTKPEDIPRL